MPQGRLQPYYITVDAETGVCTWRVEFRSNFYTSLNVQAFPFDTQHLEVLLQYVNLNPGQSRVKVTPSARGIHLFSLGWGDDLSGFKTTGMYVEVWSTMFAKQFNRVSFDFLFFFSERKVEESKREREAKKKTCFFFLSPFSLSHPSPSPLIELQNRHQRLRRGTRPKGRGPGLPAQQPP